MKKEAQRIAIAKARAEEDGFYTLIQGSRCSTIPLSHIEPGSSGEIFPDYLNDLNAAVQFAEHVASATKWKSFGIHRSVSHDGNPFYYVSFATSFTSSNPGAYLESIMNESPAKAICEAGLRALGKWIPTPEGDAGSTSPESNVR